MQIAWAEAGRDPEQFWRLTLRQIDYVLTGDSKRLIREHNLAMSVAWHTARMTAYAPEKGKDFIKLEKLQYRDKPKDGPADWRDKLAEARAWVGSFKKRG